MILRCTSRMLELVGSNSLLVDRPADDDDWYANAFYVERKKCFLLVHARTLFSAITLDVAVRFLRPVDTFVLAQIDQALEAEGLPLDALGITGDEDVQLARTASRSVLASMNDMVQMIRQIVAHEGGIRACDATTLGRFLHNTPNGARGFSTPLELVSLPNGSSSLG